MIVKCCLCCLFSYFYFASFYIPTTFGAIVLYIYKKKKEYLHKTKFNKKKVFYYSTRLIFLCLRFLGQRHEATTRTTGVRNTFSLRSVVYCKRFRRYICRRQK